MLPFMPQHQHHGCCWQPDAADVKKLPAQSAPSDSQGAPAGVKLASLIDRISCNNGSLPGTTAACGRWLSFAEWCSMAKQMLAVVVRAVQAVLWNTNLWFIDLCVLPRVEHMLCIVRGSDSCPVL
jgi:hypothetical protein